MSKRLRIFAGPNGSGKSTVVRKVIEKYPVWYFVNADHIEREIRDEGSFDFLKFDLAINTEYFFDFLRASSFNQKSGIQNLLSNLSVKNNRLFVKGDQDIGYLGALVADFLRAFLLNEGVTFAFETVFSHRSKLEFIEYANIRGYKTYLYFIGTESPEINISRVQNRVQQGGHDVPKDKITNRYYRSMELLHESLRTVYKGYVFDNSGSQTEQVLRKNRDGKISFTHDTYPDWVYQYLVSKL